MSDGFRPLDSDPALPWQVIYTRPQAERATEQRIRSLGGVAWLPMESRRNARRQTVTGTIFPRYLFAQGLDKAVIRNAGGEEMAQVLRSASGRHLLLGPEEMTRLLTQCAPDGMIHASVPREARRGDLVRVTSGPLADWRGICRLTSRDRVWVMLSVLGDTVLRRDQVELAA